MPDPAVAAPVGWAGLASVRRYTGTPPEMHQPAMSENLLCMHLGGAKEVRRWHDGRMDVHIVDLGALTIMPAEQSNRWMTRGPIDFAHILLSPDTVRQIALEEFGRDPQASHLIDRVGFRDPHIEMLFSELLNAVESGRTDGRLYVDSLAVLLTVRLLRSHSNLMRREVADAEPVAHRRGGLAPRRLRLVIDYMQAHLAADISLADLMALTGLSRAQFFRAFKQSTGLPPHRYLTSVRLEAAKTMLDGHRSHPEDVGRAVGICSSARFAALFRQHFGATLRAYLASRS